jgi:branched-chain amino acid transport system substrate-binding protein
VPAGALGPSEVVIGFIRPLTGNFANLGQLGQWATQTAIDIVNNPHPDIDLPFAAGEGLPNLGGAKIRGIWRDDQSRGDLSRTIAEQLITVDRVHWLDGTGISSSTALVQPIAETYGIPYGCHPCSSPSLTRERDLQWFFRTGPHDGLMLANVMQFLEEWPQHGGPTIQTVALLSADNIFAQDGHKIFEELSRQAGYQIVENLTTAIGASSFASEVQRLQAANPDVLFLTLYTAESLAFQNDMVRANWMPKLVVTNNGQYSDQQWLDAQKRTNHAVAWIGRDPTSIDISSLNPNYAKVNAIFHKYSHGVDMGENPMRDFTGSMWIYDTINRAGSLDPAALQKAARETNMRPEQMIIEYQGIQFDERGQNTLATGVVTQVGWDGDKHTLWPWEAAAGTGYEPILENPSWAERAAAPKPAG